MDTKSLSLIKTQLLKPEIAFPLIAFVVPLVVSGPQLLTGTIINSILYVSAVKLKPGQWFLVALIPSVSALAHNMLFGPQTMFLLYFLPMIWLGNLALMTIYKKSATITPFPVAVLSSSLLKTAILYFSSLIYFQLHLVPKIFITSMGILQLVTAIAGGFFATYLMMSLNKKS